MRALLLGVLVLAGCGDPAAPFLGKWTGSQTADVFANGNTESSAVIQTLTITEDGRSGDLVFDDGCGMTARASKTGFDLAPLSNCLAASPGPAQCGVIATITSGGVVMDRAALVMDWVGRMSTFSCPNGGSVQADYATHFRGTRQ